MKNPISEVKRDLSSKNRWMTAPLEISLVNLKASLSEISCQNQNLPSTIGSLRAINDDIESVEEAIKFITGELE